MKKYLNIIKIGFVFLVSVFIIFEVYILVNSPKIAGLSDEMGEENEEAEEADLIEVEIPAVPLGNFTIYDYETDETEAPEEAAPIEPEIAPAPEIKPEPAAEPATKAPEPTTEPAAPIAAPVVPKELISKNMPVLMYHTSSEQNPGGLTELYVKPSEFEKQIKYLAENGFTFCTFDDYYNLNDIAKPVFITFDDGYKENYTEIFPILKKYEAKITIFLVVSNVEAENFNVEMIKEMSDSGLVKFESHTLNHIDLAAISSNEDWLMREIGDSKTKIEEITKKPVIALAYPAGKFDDAVKTKVKEFYSFAILSDPGIHKTDFDPLEIRRIRINRSTSLSNFISLVG